MTHAEAQVKRDDDAFWYDAERNQRKSERIAELVTDCIKGQRDDFWLYDNPEIQAAVKRSFTAIGLSDAERWRVLQRDVLREIDKHANAVAEDEA